MGTRFYEILLFGAFVVEVLVPGKFLKHEACWRTGTWKGRFGFRSGSTTLLRWRENALPAPSGSIGFRAAALMCSPVGSRPEYRCR